ALLTHPYSTSLAMPTSFPSTPYDQTSNVLVGVAQHISWGQKAITQIVDSVRPRWQTTPTAAVPMAGAWRRSRCRKGAGAAFVLAPQSALLALPASGVPAPSQANFEGPQSQVSGQMECASSPNWLVRRSP